MQFKSGTAYLAQATLMSDGNLEPSNHDGMAAFPGPQNTTILVRNIATISLNYRW